MPVVPGRFTALWASAIRQSVLGQDRAVGRYVSPHPGQGSKRKGKGELGADGGKSVNQPARVSPLDALSTTVMALTNLSPFGPAGVEDDETMLT